MGRRGTALCVGLLALSPTGVAVGQTASTATVAVTSTAPLPRLPDLSSLTLTLTATPTRAGPPSAEVDRRLDLIRGHLQDNQLHAQLWMWGRLTLFGLGLGVQAPRAILTDNKAARAARLVSVTKSLIGLATFPLKVPRARHGADGLETSPTDDYETRLKVLKAAEAALREDARQSSRRYSWLSHVLSLALNVAGALVVGLGFDDWPRALTQAGISIAIGELTVWSAPWQAQGQWDAYRETYTPLR